MFEHLNKLPEEQHGVDIMRVREWCLAGLGRNFRQTLVLTSFLSAEINSLAARLCCNHAGRTKLEMTHKGVLSKVRAGFSLDLG